MSQLHELFYKILANNSNLTGIKAMNMIMDKQGRNMRGCFWKKYRKSLDYIKNGISSRVTEIPGV
jgi:hypothetical protein